MDICAALISLVRNSYYVFLDYLLKHLLKYLGNLVMHNTIERIHVGKKYGDIPLGVFIIRGENVVLIGDLDPEKEEAQDFEYVEAQEIIALQRIDRENKQKIEEARSKALKERGLSPRENLIDEI